MPKRVQSMHTGLHGVDIITPRTSTVDYVQDNNYCELARFTESLKHSVDKRLPLCLDCQPTQNPLLYRYVIVDFTTLSAA